MIKALWTDISLDNYNKWYPLTGKITDTPQQYINTWTNVNEWFTTFAIRAENDINAYLNFILYKFPFDSFKDKLIKETLTDMVYVMIEHWVFNRTPIEFNVDATIQFNNGTQFSANSIPTINVWDLAPSRMKILAQLTQLKQLLMSYDEQEIDVDKIDLAAFYTRNQVDELINNEKLQRISGDKNNHDFTLSKQIKLYDDVVTDNEHEVLRGAVTKLVNKSFIATEYNPETETMILNWPAEVGTLPPQALQNNPQVSDFTHAATADFSAKQQKRITTNENNINLAKQEIENIKNNYFNIETSPLWKKVENQNIELKKWYTLNITITYTDKSQNKFEKIDIKKNSKVFLDFVSIEKDKIAYVFESNCFVDERILPLNKVERGWCLLYSIENKMFDGFTFSYPLSPTIQTWINIDEIYQYQGIDTPTEFIAEKSIEHDYYTKTETDAKFQNKIIGNASTITSGADGYIDEKNQIRIYDAPKEPVATRIIKYNTYSDLNTTNKTIIGGINEVKSFLASVLNVVNEKQNITDNYLKTTNKTIIGAINELQINNKKLLDIITILIEKFKNIPIWKEVGSLADHGEQITYNFVDDKKYRVWYHFGNGMDKGGMPRSYILKEFYYNGQFNSTSSYYLDYWITKDNKRYELEIFADKIVLKDPEHSPSLSNGEFWKLEELQ